MASKQFDVIVHGSNGLPTNGPAPSFSYYAVFNSAGTLVSPQPGQPLFTQVPNETGRYTFSVTLSEGQFLRAQIDKGNDPSKYEYLRIDYADLLDLSSVLSGVEETKAAAVLVKKILANKVLWNATTAIMDEIGRAHV